MLRPVRGQLHDEDCVGGAGGGTVYVSGTLVTETSCVGYDLYWNGIWVQSVVEGCEVNTCWIAAQ